MLWKLNLKYLYIKKAKRGIANKDRKLQKIHYFIGENSKTT